MQCVGESIGDVSFFILAAALRRYMRLGINSWRWNATNIRLYSKNTTITGHENLTRRVVRDIYICFFFWNAIIFMFLKNMSWYLRHTGAPFLSSPVKI